MEVVERSDQSMKRVLIITMWHKHV